MILVNNIPLDISKETPVSFNIDWMDIRKIGDVTVQGVVSIGIDLPASNRNTQALGHFSPVTERSNVIPYQYAPNGNIVIEGLLRVEERSKDVIKIRLTAGSSDWIDQVKTIDASEVDMGVRRFNQDDYIATLTDQTDILFPFFRFFEDQFNSNTIHVNNFKPAVNAGTFIKRYFQLVNYKANFFGKMKILDKIHMLRGTPNSAIVNNQDAITALDAAAGIGDTYSWGRQTLALYNDFLVPICTSAVTDDGGNNVTLVNFNHLTAPAANGGVSVDNVYAVYSNDLGASYRVRLDLRLINRLGNPNNEGATIWIKAVRAPFPGVEINTLTGMPPVHTYAETQISYTGHIGNFFNFIPNDFNVTLPEFVLPQGEAFMLCFYYVLPQNATASRWIEVYRSNVIIETQRTLISDGLFYKVSDCLPDSKGADIIRSMVQNFNGIVETKGFNVNFYNRDEWYLDTFDDWTNKVDHLQPIVHTPISDISKRLLYEYEVDERDAQQTIYRTRESKEYGSAIVELQDDLLSGEDKATKEVKFAASMPESAPSYEVAVGYRDGEVANVFANNYSMKDRILLNKGSRSLTYTLGGADGDLTVNTYINAGFEELKFENLIPQYFPKTLTFLNIGEFVECSVRLTPNDYQSLDYRKAKLIRLSDGNIAKAWINKISDLRPHMNTATRIEFIILKNRGTADRNGRAYDNGYDNGYQ